MDIVAIEEIDSAIIRETVARLSRREQDMPGGGETTTELAVSLGLDLDDA